MPRFARSHDTREAREKNIADARRAGEWPSAALAWLEGAAMDYRRTGSRRPVMEFAPTDAGTWLSDGHIAVVAGDAAPFVSRALEGDPLFWAPPDGQTAPTAAVYSARFSFTARPDTARPARLLPLVAHDGRIQAWPLVTVDVDSPPLVTWLDGAHVDLVRSMVARTTGDAMPLVRPMPGVVWWTTGKNSPAYASTSPDYPSPPEPLAVMMPVSLSSVGTLERAILAAAAELPR